VYSTFRIEIEPKCKDDGNDDVVKHDTAANLMNIRRSVGSDLLL